ncbi:hypothetical protein [Micromonospora sp. NPDC048169]|uniref:hypothetical protein n=1 Tax=Micromonospora sp. NPDC048169 TaxID=3154711 RepID=UPI0033C5E41F
MTVQEEARADRAIQTKQIPITCYPPATAHEIEQRYRCIDARHEGRTYNPVQDKTWCLCGRVIRPGDVSRWNSAYESAEFSAGRPDAVGREARAYLDAVHGRGNEPEPLAVPTECGDQYVIEMEEVPSWQ